MVNKDEVLAGLMHGLSATQQIYENADNRLTLDLHGGVDGISEALVQRFKSKETESFMWLFALIEKYLREGDIEVKEILSYGLIDHLQDRLIKNEIKLNAFDPWIRPETKTVWKSMIDIWSQTDGPEK